MTEYDQKLIRFLLSANKKKLYAWYRAASDEDLNYASSLMTVYGNALEDEIRVVEDIEKEITNMTTLMEAQAVIASVR